jgi:hypothetical protein
LALDVESVVVPGGEGRGVARTGTVKDRRRSGSSVPRLLDEIVGEKASEVAHPL